MKNTGIVNFGAGELLSHPKLFHVHFSNGNFLLNELFSLSYFSRFLIDSEDRCSRNQHTHPPSV